jgi:hypothetical protein
MMAGRTPAHRPPEGRPARQGTSRWSVRRALVAVRAGDIGPRTDHTAAPAPAAWQALPGRSMCTLIRICGVLTGWPLGAGPSIQDDAVPPAALRNGERSAWRGRGEPQVVHPHQELRCLCSTWNTNLASSGPGCGKASRGRSFNRPPTPPAGRRAPARRGHEGSPPRPSSAGTGTWAAGLPTGGSWGKADPGTARDRRAIRIASLVGGKRPEQATLETA